jgi:RNA polymerase sigma-70 factor, ECF subfamily
LSPTGVNAEVAMREDDLLMSQVKDGSVDAFEELYDRYCDRTYRVAWSICHDQGLAQDAIQEAFLSIWKNRTAYQPQRGTVATWLFTIVRYRALDVARRDHKHASRRAGEHTLPAHLTSGKLAEQVTSRKEAHRLQTLLTRLPDAQREVITLAFYGQLTHTEIATVLGLPEGTIKGRIRLGLHELRQAIDQVAA